MAQAVCLSQPQQDLFKALKEGGVDPSLFPTLNLPAPTRPLKLQIFSKALQGSRNEMEDAHFDCQLPEGHLMGIFDGHGEKGVIARRAAQVFQTTFSKQFQTYAPDFKKLFKEICHSIQPTITHPIGGTTALVCYFNPNTHLLYISNLGDSKAKIFRKIEGQIHCLPVSLHRDWASPKDADRVKKIFDTITFDAWIRNPAKKRYFPSSKLGVNVSRSLGDKCMEINGQTAISRSPRTTCIQLKENDIVIMGCDGFWDFVSDQEITDRFLTLSWDNPQLATLLTQHALKTSTDNISVMCAFAKTEVSDTTDLDSTQSFEDSE
jgi:serine/threonine protein phosphatase PrpC